MASAGAVKSRRPGRSHGRLAAKTVRRCRGAVRRCRFRDERKVETGAHDAAPRSLPMTSRLNIMAPVTHLLFAAKQTVEDKTQSVVTARVLVPNVRMNGSTESAECSPCPRLRGRSERNYALTASSLRTSSCESAMQFANQTCLPTRSTRAGRCLRRRSAKGSPISQ
jgi:hypothetical protein